MGRRVSLERDMSLEFLAPDFPIVLIRNLPWRQGLVLFPLAALAGVWPNLQQLSSTTIPVASPHPDLELVELYVSLAEEALPQMASRVICVQVVIIRPYLTC